MIMLKTYILDLSDQNCVRMCMWASSCMRRIMRKACSPEIGMFVCVCVFYVVCRVCVIAVL